jgi:hypothetical protein
VLITIPKELALPPVPGALRVVTAIEVFTLPFCWFALPPIAILLPPLVLALKEFLPIRMSLVSVPAVASPLFWPII